MSSFSDHFSPKEWEAFCETMLRQHYGAKNFWKVPDEDCGDLGLEFFTIDGTLFQCYCPDKGVNMATYKKKIQTKINDDLNKLKKNEAKIKKIIDDITVHQWVLVTPEFKSKDLIAYCNKKKKEIINKNISYINNSEFIVKIETADSYPAGKRYAQGIYNNAINIPMIDVTAVKITTWKTDNSEFFSNINRKSNSLMGNGCDSFQDQVVSKYIQIEKFLDQLREDYPDLHALIEDSARAQLEDMREKSVLEEDIGREFVTKIVKNNKDSFSKYSEYMSDKNMQSLSFGYLSKWLAECYMDFKS